MTRIQNNRLVISYQVTLVAWHSERSSLYRNAMPFITGLFHKRQDFDA